MMTIEVFVDIFGRLAEIKSVSPRDHETLAFDVKVLHGLPHTQVVVSDSEAIEHKLNTPVMIA